MTETIGMVLDRIEAQQARELEALPHDHTALQLGQALYRCRSLSWRERWRVGRDILPYETPKLGSRSRSVSNHSQNYSIEG